MAQSKFNSIVSQISQRRYYIFDGADFQLYTYTLADIIENNESELAFSMQDNIDPILDLRKDEIATITYRDDPTSAIIIKRIS